MRCLSRMGLGLVGLSLVAPSGAWAEPPSSDSAPSSAAAAPRRGWGWLHRPRLCASCQRAALQAKGIAVPPAPPLPQVGLVPTRQKCDRCGATVTMMAPPGPGATGARPAYAYAPGSAPAAPGGAPVAWAFVPPSPAPPAPGGAACVPCEAGTPGADAPGYAVAGGAGAPGQAIIGGTVAMAEPTPIGVVQGRYAYGNAPAGAGRAGVAAMLNSGPGLPGSGDASVMPSSFSTDPYDPVGHNRPHILSHLFGLDAIGQRGREERERRLREKHASISYQPQSGPVTELPASMVYGR